MVSIYFSEFLCVSFSSFNTNKIMLEDFDILQAIELRGLGKTVVLGQKNCESKDLFSSHPQMMTISINSNGSLKLRIIVTWK